MDVIDVPRLPVAFQYFEVRPVLNVDGGCISFTDEAEFEAERARLRADDADVEAIWMIFGIDKEGIGHAVGDYVHKDSAHRLMRAILAPMIGALEELDAGSVHNAKGEEMRDRIVTAAALLEDFVNQCSNEERI